MNKLLVVDDCAVRIVEVEAYHGETDPGSHSFRGQTPRNENMFKDGGILYVYFTYGMHFCANVVTGTKGTSEAVLLRAAEPIDGIDLMRERRGPKISDRDLCRGPARLCQALGLNRDDNGVSLISRGSPVFFADDGTSPPKRPAKSIRVGLSTDDGRLARFLVPGNPFISR